MVWNSLESNLQHITHTIQYLKNQEDVDTFVLYVLERERDVLLAKLNDLHEKAQED